MSNDSKVTSLDTPDNNATASAKAADTADKSPAKRATSKSSGNGTDLSGKTATINIYPSDQDGGNDAVFVAHNGVAFQIPRGENIEVPIELIEILNNAVTTVTSPAPEGGVTTREVPRYNFRRIG